jgi:hypothetical protein
MGVDESVEAYCALAEESFRKTHITTAQRVLGRSQFRSSNLRSALRRLVKGRLGDSEAKLLDTEFGCKMYVPISTPKNRAQCQY